MSDDWQVPDDLADRIRRLDRTDAWAREIERTAEVRAILTDLIAELREGHPTFGDEPPLWVKTALYAAEARLREVQHPRHDEAACMTRTRTPP